jgi:dienelactone hydrolase
MADTHTSSSKGGSMLRNTLLLAGLALGAPTSPVRAADFVPADTVRHVDVVVGEGSDWPLPGTLSIPAGAGPFPAVVLVHGSGPHDRDQTVGPNRPFREIALGLADRGVAALRYEKRTKEHGARLPAIRNFTAREEVVDDALAAIELLRATPGIDGARVVVAGHSLGGMLAPRIGAADPALAGIAILCGPVRSIETMILDQVAYIRTLDDTPVAQQQVLGYLEAQARQVEAIDLAAPDSNATPLGAPMSYWLDMKRYDPTATARAFDRPIYIVHAGRDYQVTTVDLDGWKGALAGRRDVTIKEYADLNHLFHFGTDLARPSEYGNTADVAVVVIDDLAAWVRALAGR